MKIDEQYRNALWLLIYTAAVCFSHIHQGTLSVDGIRYAHISQQILKRADWLNLWDEFMGQPYANKPPVLFWLTAVSFKLFGESTFSARLSGSIFAAFSVILLWALVKRHFAVKAAWCAVALYSLNATFFRAIVELSFEGMLLSGTLLLLAALLILCERERLSLGEKFLAGLGIFLLLASKAPYLLLMAVPAAVVFGYRGQMSRLIQLAVSGVPALLLLMAWHLLRNWHLLHDAVLNQFVRPLEHPDGWVSSAASWSRELLYYAPLSIISLGVLISLAPRGLNIGNDTDGTQKEILLFAWTAMAIPILLLIEARGPYLMPPLVGVLIISAKRVSPFINDLIVARYLPLIAIGVTLSIVALGAEVHRTSAIVALFRKYPELFSKTPIICVDGEVEPTSRATKKRMQLLLDFEFGALVPIVSSRQLPLATIRKGTRLVAEPRCAKRLAHLGLPLALEASMNGVEAYSFWDVPHVPDGYLPEPDPQAGLSGHDH